MWITFSDGNKREGRIYTSTNSTMRVAVDGFEDLIELTSISNQWVSENCEPLTIEFEWHNQRADHQAVAETDCICSPELADRLIRHLYSEDEAVQPVASAGAAG